jgi:hypothetical protein
LAGELGMPAAGTAIFGGAAGAEAAMAWFNDKTNKDRNSEMRNMPVLG